MKKHKIAVALVCVVFFACARGAIAHTDEEQIALIPIEWKMADGYLPDWFEPGEVNYLPNAFSPNAPYSAYDNRGMGPFNSPVGVPEPGSLVLLTGGGLCLLGWAWRKRRRR